MTDLGSVVVDISVVGEETEQIVAFPTKRHCKVEQRRSLAIALESIGSLFVALRKHLPDELSQQLDETVQKISEATEDLERAAEHRAQKDEDKEVHRRAMRHLHGERDPG